MILFFIRVAKGMIELSKVSQIFAATLKRCQISRDHSGICSKGTIHILRKHLQGGGGWALKMTFFASIEGGWSKMAKYLKMCLRNEWMVPIRLSGSFATSGERENWWTDFWTRINKFFIGYLVKYLLSSL